MTIGTSLSTPEDIANQRAKKVEEAIKKVSKGDSETAAKLVHKTALEADMTAKKALEVVNREFNFKACQKAIHDLLDKGLEAMMKEVKSEEEIISEGKTIKSLEDAVVLEYDHLVNKEMLKTNLQEVCKVKVVNNCSFTSQITRAL